MMPMPMKPLPPSTRSAGNRLNRTRGQASTLAPFFLSATMYLLVAAALGLAQALPSPLGSSFAMWRWPAIHLAFVGGATQLIVGSMTYFAVPLLMTSPPPRRLVRAQWVFVNLGALMLAAGALVRIPWLSVSGGVAVLLALALLLQTLRLLRRRSLAKPDATLRYYETAIVFLAIGAILGILMLLGLSDLVVPRDRVRLTHMHLNLVGWVTLTIVGTMRFFFGSVLGTTVRKANPLWAEYWPLAGGTAVLAIGWMVGSMAMVGVGSMLQAVGVVVYSAAIVRQWRAHQSPLSLAGGHLVAATFWLLAMTFGGIVAGGMHAASLPGASGLTAAVGTIGFVGFIGQTILGAWTHLFSVVVSLVAASPEQGASIRPRIRAVLAARRGPQLLLANLGTFAIVLGAGTDAIGSPIATACAMVGVVTLAVVFGIVVAKAGRVFWLLWQARRGTLPAVAPSS